MSESNNNQPDGKQPISMTDWIRFAAGRMPAAATQPEVEQPRKYVTANAGNGTRGPVPDIETTAQKMNRWIRFGERSR